MQNVTITLNVAEIVYDIQNKTYLTGKSRSDGTNHAHVAAMQANDDDENANQILRSVQTAFGMLRTKLSEYLDISVHSAGNQLMKTGGKLELALLMPSNYNLSTADTIATAAHQYIVALAVKDWFTITHKTDATEYASIAESSLAIIAEAVSKRLRPRREESENASL